MIRLLRYNFRVLMFGHWWILVFPIAASQLMVFWNLVTLRFEPSLPSRSMETVPPLLAAFLCAHVLSAEYRSGVGAILASKPVDIGKVVAVRMAVVLLLVWALALLSLVAFYYGWEPYAVWPAFGACVPSTLFLGMLALAFATVFRNPWAGFGVAAVWWAMDRAPGVLINPFLSLRSVSASMVPENMHRYLVFTRYAWEPKVVLSLLAFLLYAWHSRLIYTLGAGHVSPLRRRGLLLAVLVPLLYAASGACLKVGYLYWHRGQLLPDDTAWIRTQLAPFGPVPVARLFGPVFAAYVGDIPNTWRLQAGDEADVYGDTAKHRREVAEMVRKGVRSIWGSNLAELYSRLEVPSAPTLEARIALLELVVKRYPDGPHAAGAYVRMAREYLDAGAPEKAREACENALKVRHTGREAADALRMLTAMYAEAGDLARAVASARRWFDVSDTRQRIKAGAQLVELLQKSGRADEVRWAARATLKAIQEFREEVRRTDEARMAGTDTPLIRESDALEPRLRQLE